ncbi:MAG: ABC transporter ATP-binding protein, partial [Waterburya sp.]
MLGYTQAQMVSRAKYILEFAELENYALVPVKGLSSGMTARLGFAIATDVKPDILILDEVLSVGDVSFKNKCKQRMEEFWQDHVTVLLVSHSMALILQNCHKTIWMERGQIKMVGTTKDVVTEYLNCVAPDETIKTIKNSFKNET